VLVACAWRYCRGADGSMSKTDTSTQSIATRYGSSVCVGFDET
jgi:hypothetical protein